MFSNEKVDISYCYSEETVYLTIRFSRAVEVYLLNALKNMSNEILKLGFKDIEYVSGLDWCVL